MAVKNIYEQYSVITIVKKFLTILGEQTGPTNKNTIAKVGVAATDTSGNLSTKLINYLPDDIFIDNKDARYSEIYGNWSTSNNCSYGIEMQG